MYLTDKFLAGDEIGSLYAGKLIQGPDGRWFFMASRLFAPDGEFIGEIIDPLPVTVHSDGRLSLQR